MASHTIEIARQDGTEFRSVRLTPRDDGEIKMDAQDMGPTVETIWGDTDYEFWVRIARPRCRSSPSNCCATSSPFNSVRLTPSATGAKHAAWITNSVFGSRKYYEYRPRRKIAP
jgi:hypothetical protein